MGYYHVELSHHNVNRKLVTELFMKKYPTITSLHFSDRGMLSIYSTEEPTMLQELLENYGIPSDAIFIETEEDRQNRMNTEDSSVNENPETPFGELSPVTHSGGSND